MFNMELGGGRSILLSYRNNYFYYRNMIQQFSCNVQCFCGCRTACIRSRRKSLFCGLPYYRPSCMVSTTARSHGCSVIPAPFCISCADSSSVPLSAQDAVCCSPEKLK